MKTEESNLIIRISQSDRRAFEEVFQDNYALLCNYAYKIIFDRDEAEEIAQDVFVKFWGKRKTIEINTSLRSYLITSVKHACFNLIKHKKIKKKYEEEVVDSRSFHTEDSLENKELGIYIHKAIDKLPEQQKNVFILSRLEGKKYREISEELSISVKTVENHMGRALAALRQDLSGYLVTFLLLLIIFYSLLGVFGNWFVI